MPGDINWKEIGASKSENDQLQEALKRGKAKGLAQITNALFEQALSGSVGAACFYLKNRDSENQDQKDSHDELGEEGKYHYEFHFKDINSKQIKSLKSGFEGYTWDMGFAVTDFEFKEEGDLFKILFESKKYFDNEDDDWDDQDFAQNIVTRILGKEQFICSALWSVEESFEEKDIVFIDDKQNEWSVEVGKHGGLNQILRDRKIALKAVKNDGWALENADKSLRADREVVLTAVKDVGWMLEHASKKLQNDPELKKIAEG